ncbi:MAG TPA: hypothetical protein VFX64_03775 [Candidatus Nitrosotalea sp.]|nr:hypothetical protein [Candidatus Nitrosotalea sp.]
MKTLYLSIIIGLVYASCFVLSGAHAQDCMGGPFCGGNIQSTVDNRNVTVSLNFYSNSTMPDNVHYLWLRFFDTKNDTLIKNVSFFINATKDNKVLMHELFYTKTGLMLMKFYPSHDTEKLIINGTSEPMLGGMMSENDTLPITTSVFAENGIYNIHLEVLAMNNIEELIDPSNPITFDSQWLVDEKGNISKYDNSTTISQRSSSPHITIEDMSPLQQFKSGIAFNDVKCKQGLHLVIKTKDNSPACVKLDTAYMLIKKGWAASESAYPGGDRQFAPDTNSTIIPAHLPRSSGVRVPYYESSRVINYRGFDGVYNETFPYRGTQNDYVLEPGNTGVMTFKIDAMISEEQDQDYPIPLPKSLNRTNYAMFYHEITNLKDLSKYPGVTIDDSGYDFEVCSTGPAGGGSCIGEQFGGTGPIEAFVTDHHGVDVLFEPPLEVLPLSMNATSQVVTMTITADSNASRGTYLVVLPGMGADSFLLTVGDKPYHE